MARLPLRAKSAELPELLRMKLVVEGLPADIARIAERATRWEDRAPVSAWAEDRFQ